MAEQHLIQCTASSGMRDTLLDHLGPTPWPSIATGLELEQYSFIQLVKKFQFFFFLNTTKIIPSDEIIGFGYRSRAIRVWGNIKIILIGIS